MAEIVHLGDFCKLQTEISEADQFNRSLRAARDLLCLQNSELRKRLLTLLAAGEFCEYGGHNACRTLATNQLGEFVARVVVEINATFPPPGEVPFA